MDFDKIANARRNIRLYPILKVFNKRVFVPIIPIYYTEYVGFSIPELGLLAAFAALANMLMNVPAGYIADRFGRSRALRISAMALMLATVFFFAMPTQLGIIIGVALEAIGFAFISGAGESLVHDSLGVIERPHDYSKVLSRAQSIALLVNAALVALVPITYIIDPRMPFAIGTLAFLVMLVAAYYMHDVGDRVSPRRIVLRWPGFGSLRRISSNSKLLIAVMLFGVVGAIYFSFDIITIGLREYGIQPQYLGWIYSAASVFGALLGLVIHHLKRLSLSAYLVLDVSILLLLFTVGYMGNVWLLAAAAIVSISFWRYRRIIYQDHLLSRYSTGYKTTLLSVMNTTESLNTLWVPIVTTGTVGAFGVSNGFGLLAVGTFFVAVIYVIAMRRAFLRRGA